MYTCTAKAGCMAVLLDTRIGIEQAPEPFRLQPDLILTVPYSEYTKYVHSLSLDSQTVRLFSNTRATVNLSIASPERLYNTFMRDLAFAIVKEIYYAECLKENATVIVPSSERAAPMSWTVFLQKSSKMQSNMYELLDRVGKLGYHCKAVKNVHNKLLLDIADRLYTISKSESIQGELNLAY